MSGLNYFFLKTPKHQFYLGVFIQPYFKNKNYTELELKNNDDGQKSLKENMTLLILLSYHSYQMILGSWYNHKVPFHFKGLKPFRGCIDRPIKFSNRSKDPGSSFWRFSKVITLVLWFKTFTSQLIETTNIALNVNQVALLELYDHFVVLRK
jgi:hypothetical protein